MPPSIEIRAHIGPASGHMFVVGGSKSCSVWCVEDLVPAPWAASALEERPSLVAIAAISAIFTAEAATSARTARAKYQGPGEIEVGSAVIIFGPIRVEGEQVAGGVRIETRADERFVSLEIVDESGQAVKGHVEQHRKGNAKLLGHFCGSTDRRLRIKPGKPLMVYPGSAPCGGNSIGATQGVVIARFSN
jgi:hypothetical protein